MKITSIKHRVAFVPVKFPVVSSVRQTDRICFVLVDIETDEGITGISYVQAFHTEGASAIRACLNYLESVVIGQHPSHIETIWRRMWDAIKLLGHQGLPVFAMSLIDIALWDLWGKVLNCSVCRLMGGQPGVFAAYQSDGLWLVSPEKAAKQATAFAMEGFTALKMRLGRSELEADVRSLAEIRNAIGEKIELIGDVNQGWTMETTIIMADRLYSLGLNYLEEPIEADYAEGYAQLSKSLRIPVVTGENLYMLRSFHRFLKMEGASVYTPDLQRVGGITGFRRIQMLLEQYEKLCSLHLFPEYAVHLFPLMRNSRKIEWMSWAGPLFELPLVCQDGLVQTPDRPGFGMTWDETAISRYQIYTQ